MNERAFARAAEDYAARLYTVAFRLLRNRADAEDAVLHALTWLADLPRDVAEQIAFKNGDRLFPAP